MPIFQMRRLKLRGGHTEGKRQRQICLAPKPSFFEPYHTHSLQKLVPRPPEVTLIPEGAWRLTPMLLTRI